jgi:hypothetical protein
MELSAALSDRITQSPGYRFEWRLLELRAAVYRLAREASEARRLADAIAREAPVEFFAEYSAKARALAIETTTDLDALNFFYGRWMPDRLAAYYQPQLETLDRLLRARARLPKIS